MITDIIKGTWPLLMGTALLMVGNGLQGTLLGLRASSEGFPTIVTGLVMSAYYIGLLVSSMVTPKLVSQVGHIRVFAAFASVSSISVLLHALFLDPVVWFFMRLITGFCYAGLYVVAESWLNDRADNETRGSMLSIYMIIQMAGLAAAQLLLNLSTPDGFPLFILVSVLVSLALVPISLTSSSVPELRSPEPISPLGLYRISPLGFIGSFLVGVAQSAQFGMGAVFGNLIGFSVAEVSVYMGLYLAGALVVQYPIGAISDRFDRRMVIMAVTFFAAVVALAGFFAALSANFTALLVVITIYGAAAMPLYALCLAHANDYMKPSQILGASATLVMTYGCGAIFGPLLAGTIMEEISPPSFFIMLVLLQGMIGVFALYRMTRRAAVPLDEQGSYVTLAPRTTPLAAAAAVADAADIQIDPDDSDDDENDENGDTLDMRGM